MPTRTLAILLVACLVAALGSPAAYAQGPARTRGDRTSLRCTLTPDPLALAGGDGYGGEATATRGASPRDLLLSALVPGLGELRTGHTRMAAVHFAAEAAIWTSFVVFRVQGGLRRDDYVEYAEVFAGVRDVSGRSDNYFKELARYIRSDPGPNSYNEREVRDTARALYPDDPDARQRYIEAHEYTGDLAWDWETVDNWRTYRELRESSELSLQRSRFCIGAAVANRIASVLGLARTRGPAGSTIDVGLRQTAGSEYLLTAVSMRLEF
jgi:hypothetical protein